MTLSCGGKWFPAEQRYHETIRSLWECELSLWVAEPWVDVTEMGPMKAAIVWPRAYLFRVVMGDNVFTRVQYVRVESVVWREQVEDVLAMYWKAKDGASVSELVDRLDALGFGHAMVVESTDDDMRAVERLERYMSQVDVICLEAGNE